MLYVVNLWLFTLLVVGIVIVPGMDMLFVLTSALTGGRQTGLAATAGIMTGGVYHTVLGTVGIAMLLRLAPSAFTVLLLAGAAYMTWIGVTLLKSSIVLGKIGDAPRRSSWVVFRQGLVTCVLNPKAYVFVLSVYPQFVQRQFGAIWLQTLIFGAITVLTQLAVYGGLALAASQSRQVLSSSPRATALIGRGAGLLFVVAGPLTAWHGWAAQ
jgi:threonine/homoserine/homoserine lactone efflux protein